MKDALEALLGIYGTQQEAAKALGVTQAAISNWLNGKRRITRDMAVHIEKCTDGRVRAVDLLDLAA